MVYSRHSNEFKAELELNHSKTFIDSGWLHWAVCPSCCYRMSLIKTNFIQEIYKCSNCGVQTYVNPEAFHR